MAEITRPKLYQIPEADHTRRGRFHWLTLIEEEESAAPMHLARDDDFMGLNNSFSEHTTH